MYGPDQRDEVSRGIYEPHGPTYDMRIVAVVRLPDEIAIDEVHSPGTQFVGEEADLLVPNRFLEEHRGEYLSFGASFAVGLRPGTDPAAFIESLSKELGPGNDLLGGDASQDDRTVLFGTPVSLETTTLLAVGVGIALATVALATLLLRIQHRGLERASQAAASIGLTGTRLAATASLRVAPAALAAAIGALAVSFALSGRFPVGLGRQLELDRGIRFDAATLVIGASAIVLVVVGIAALMARRPRSMVRDARPSRSSSSWPQRLPLTPSLGVRLAAGASRRRATTAIGGVVAAAALAAVVAVAMMTVGGDRLYSQPDRRGWEWDVAIGNTNFFMDSSRLDELAQDPTFSRQTAVGYGQVNIDGFPCEVLAIDPTGSAPPQVISGRLPSSTAEVALGSGLMRHLLRGHRRSRRAVAGELGVPG